MAVSSSSSGRTPPGADENDAAASVACSAGADADAGAAAAVVAVVVAASEAMLGCDCCCGEKVRRWTWSRILRAVYLTGIVKKARLPWLVGG